MQQAAPWERYANPQPSAPPVIQGPPRQPSPQTPAQAAGDQLGAQRTQQQIQQSNTGGVNFQDEQSLRSQYQGLPEIRNYQSVAPMVQSALSASPGGAGDLNIVYSFAKVMDPGSVVREGEVQMSQGTGSLGEQINGFIQRIRTGGSLPAGVRRRLVREIQTRAEQYRAAYGQMRKQYWLNAERYGFSPDAVVGPDVDEAYQRAPGTSAPAPRPVAPTPRGAGEAVLNFGNETVDQLTRTDPRESALASPEAVSREADPLTGNNPSLTIQTMPAEEWNRQFSGAVRGGASRAELDELARSTGHQPVPDELWNAIVEHRRTGRGMTFVPNTISVNELPEFLRDQFQEQYQNQSAGRRAAEERAAWAEEHPYLASADTVVRRVANAATGGLADHFAARMNGERPAYEHGVTATDWRDRPVESFVGTAAGGAVLPYGATAARQTGAGAAYGGATGYFDTDGSFTDRLSAGARGAAIDGGTNALLAGARRAVTAPNALAVMEAGQRQNVFVPRYMVGRETSQVATGAVGATPGRIPLARAANRTIEGIENARNRAASEMGDVGDNISAGRRAQAGARQFLDDSEQRANQLYDRIPIADRTRADLSNTRAVLAETTEGMESNARLSQLFEDPQLIAYRDALAEGGLSWRDMKSFRSRIGRMIGRAQVASEGPHADDLRALYGALTRDMEATAGTQGPRALSMFRRANQYWRGREARREGVIQTILGRDFNESPEDAFRQINRWAQRDVGDVRALAQTMRSLPVDDANAVRATIFARMGRATRSNQDETGEAFSPFTFASQWSQLEPRAKALLVPNRQHRRNLEDIALLASAMRRSERFTNTSNTGLGANLGMFTLGGMANLPAAAGAGVATYTFGRLLSSPAGSRSVLRALRNPESFRGLMESAQEEED